MNPWRLWNGAFVPEWLCRRTEPSAGAKLAYARLCRFAGKEGVAKPPLDELGEELGVSTRQAGRYVRELAKLGLIDVVQRGLNLPNLYRFPAHAWMGFDVENGGPGPDTYVTSGEDGSVTSGPDTCVTSGPDTSVATEVTHVSLQERSHVSGPSSYLKSQLESQNNCADDVGARANSDLFSALERALGHAPETDVERNAWRTAVAHLRAATATTDEISRRVRRWRELYPQSPCTPFALTRHWGELGPRSNVTPLTGPHRRLDVARASCADCGGSGFVDVDVAGEAYDAVVQPCPKCNTPGEVAL